MDTQPLYLDEALMLGVSAVVLESYPPMTAQERACLKDCAGGLCLSLRSLAWAWYEGRRGDERLWRRIRQRLLSNPVVMVKE